MENPKKIRIIADQKLSDAGYLLQGKRFDNAVYLAGYAVELYLKAKIAQRLGYNNLFSDSFKQSTKADKLRNRLEKLGFLSEVQGKLITEFLRQFTIHDLTRLLDYSGLKNDYTKESSSNISLRDAWEFITSKSTNNYAWAETLRYKPVGYIKKKDATQFIESVKIVTEWINLKP